MGSVKTAQQGTLHPTGLEQPHLADRTASLGYQVRPFPRSTASRYNRAQVRVPVATDFVRHVSG